MNANGVPSALFVEAARDGLASIVDWMDDVMSVSLVETTFVPNDSTTWPAASSAFTSKDAGAVCEIQFDALSGRFYLVAPDPDEGWDFISTDDGISIVGFWMKLSSNDNPICANLFTAPISVTAVGQHITLPWVAMDVTDIILAAITPYELP